MSDEIERAAERIARYLQGAEECCYASEYDPAAKAIWIEPQINGDDICLNLASVAEAALAERSEREQRLQQWVNDLQAGMYINCVYCGHRYGPDDEVPAAMADVLKQHIEQCPEHPLNEYRELLQATRVGLGRLHGMTNDQGDLINEIDALLQQEDSE